MFTLDVTFYLHGADCLMASIAVVGKGENAIDNNILFNIISDFSCQLIDLGLVLSAHTQEFILGGLEPFGL